MGKSTIDGSFSMAMLNNQRVSKQKKSKSAAQLPRLQVDAAQTHCPCGIAERTGA